MGGTALRLLLVALLAFPASAAEGGPFLDHPKKALQLASVEGKPLLIDFHTSWCASCHLMRKTTWKDEAVVDLLGGFVALSVDAERFDSLRLRYGVDAYPTIVIATPEGDPVLVLLGFKSAEAMHGHLRAVWDDRERLLALAARAAERKPDPEDLVELASFARGREAFGQAEKLLRRALQKKKRLPESLARRATLDLVEVLTASGECRDADRLLRRMPSTPGEALATRYQTLSQGIALCGR